MRVAIVPDTDRHTNGAVDIGEALHNAFPGQLVPPASAEVVISTSRAAARSLHGLTGVPHICYLTHSSDAAISRNPQPAGERNVLALRDANSLTSVSPPGSLSDTSGGVTHYLAGNAAIAELLRTQLGFPVKVIYPVVDTRAYRPPRQPRSDYYVTVARDGEDEAVELAIAATREAKRRLVVLSDAPSSRERNNANAHVQWVSLSQPRQLQDHLRGGRGFLCTRDADFDSDVIRAHACGTPVIVSAGSPIAELIIDAELDGPGTGLLFDQPTSAAVAATMLELERRPQKYSATFAWAHAKRFSHDRFVRDLSQYIAAVLAAFEQSGTEDATQRRSAA